MRGVKRRDAVAMTKKSRVGQEMSFGRWVSEEYETLSLLHAAGVAVPKPVAMSEQRDRDGVHRRRGRAGGAAGGRAARGGEARRVFGD